MCFDWYYQNIDYYKTKNLFSFWDILSFTFLSFNLVCFKKDLTDNIFILHIFVYFIFMHLKLILSSWATTKDYWANKNYHMEQIWKVAKPSNFNILLFSLHISFAPYNYNNLSTQNVLCSVFKPRLWVEIVELIIWFYEIIIILLEAQLLSN